MKIDFILFYIVNNAQNGPLYVMIKMQFMLSNIYYLYK